MTSDPRLPRADEAEKYLLACCVVWPERAAEFLHLVRPTDFFDDRFRRLWKRFQTQLEMYGAIDRLDAGKKLNCAALLFELADCAPTTVHAESRAEMVKLAARGRHAHEIFQKAANAILRGRPADAVIAQVSLALEAFEAEAIGA
jgi:replicative DNA helicase